MLSKETIMKKCANCFEQNTDGATNCVICGEVLPVAQVGEEAPTEAKGTGLLELDRAISETEIKQLYDAGPIEPEAAKKILERAQADPKKFLEETGPLQLVELAKEPEATPDPVADPIEKARESLVASLMTVDGVKSATVEVIGSRVNPDPIAELCEKAQENVGIVIASPPEYIGEFPIKAAIEVYHDSVLFVAHTHPIVNDITLIGREDPQRDVFPDIDLAKLEGVSASNASREHLRILRQGNKFFLYVYPGSTGTQVNKEIIDESRYGKKFEIQIGDRIILGGKVRLKLIKQ
jgi:hypothetical protein